MKEWITWASPSKGHRTILTWLWLSFSYVSESTAGRQEEREREREREREGDREREREGRSGIDDSTCSLALCWRSQTGEANQLVQRRGWVCLCILQSAALTFYRSGHIYVCVCVTAGEIVCVCLWSPSASVLERGCPWCLCERVSRRPNSQRRRDPVCELLSLPAVSYQPTGG